MTCVLVVEDDDLVRETLESALAARGFRVLSARHGADAIDVIRRDGARPSVIVLDLMMPEMDGVAFLAAADHEPLLAHVPVIIHTGEPRVPDPLPAAVKAVVWKPAKLGDLLLAIDRCLIDSPTLPAPLARGTGAIPPLEPVPGRMDPTPPERPRGGLREPARRRPRRE